MLKNRILSLFILIIFWLVFNSTLTFSMRADIFYSKDPKTTKPKISKAIVKQFEQSLILDDDSDKPSKAKIKQMLQMARQAIRHKNKRYKSQGYAVRAYCYYLQKKYKQALADFNRAIGLSKEKKILQTCYLLRAKINYIFKKYDHSIQDYLKLISYQKKNNSKARFYLCIGISYLKQEQYQQAYIHLKKAIQFSPGLKGVLASLLSPIEEYKNGYPVGIYISNMLDSSRYKLIFAKVQNLVQYLQSKGLKYGSDYYFSYNFLFYFPKNLKKDHQLIQKLQDFTIQLQDIKVNITTHKNAKRSQYLSKIKVKHSELKIQSLVFSISKSRLNNLKTLMNYQLDKEALKEQINQHQTDIGNINKEKKEMSILLAKYDNFNDLFTDLLTLQNKMDKLFMNPNYRCSFKDIIFKDLYGNVTTTSTHTFPQRNINYRTLKKLVRKRKYDESIKLLKKYMLVLKFIFMNKKHFPVLMQYRNLYKDLPILIINNFTVNKSMVKGKRRITRSVSYSLFLFKKSKNHYKVFFNIPKFNQYLKAKTTILANYKKAAKKKKQNKQRKDPKKSKDASIILQMLKELVDLDKQYFIFIDTNSDMANIKSLQNQKANLLKAIRENKAELKTIEKKISQHPLASKYKTSTSKKIKKEFWLIKNCISISKKKGKNNNSSANPKPQKAKKDKSALSQDDSVDYIISSPTTLSNILINYQPIIIKYSQSEQSADFLAKLKSIKKKANHNPGIIQYKTYWTIFAIKMKPKAHYIVRRSIRLREKPSRKAKKILLLKKGKRVMILDSNSRWYKIEINSQQGWIEKKYLKKMK